MLRRLWRGYCVLGAVLLVAVVCGGVVRAQAAPASHRQTASALMKPPKMLPVPTIATSGPGIAPVPEAGNAVIFGNGENLAGKTLTAIHLPQLSVYAYPIEANETDPNFPPPLNVRQVAWAWIISNPTTQADQDAGVVPPYISYGTIPTVHVQTLGFGAIPISADLTLQQTVNAATGKVNPLIVYAASKTSTFTLSGLLSVHLANVTVDGTPLNLSPSCTTVSPAKLTAYATSAQYRIPLGGLLSGDTNIPAFTGCNATIDGRTENVDDLLTGTLSGTDNPTFLTQNGLGSYDPAKAQDCYPAPPSNYPFPYQLGCLPEPPTLPPLPKLTASIPVPVVTTSDYDPPAYG